MTPETIDVLFVVFDEFQILDVSGPAQVLASANDELATLGRPPLYRIRIGAPRAGDVRSSSGLTLTAQALPRRPRAHTIVIPGGPGVWNQPARQPLVNWLAAAAPHAQRLASVCTGAFLLARAGLLDGGRAVTHWAACEQFEREFPAVRVHRDAIYFRQGRLWTSAGVTTGIDMMLAMVQADAGREIALAVAKKLVVFYRRPGGQSQFSSALLEQSADDPRIGELRHWIGLHLRERIDVDRLASQLAMTPRTFARFYRQQTGVTPARAVEHIRLEKACAMIESGRRSIKAVADQCGFSSEEVMRRVFLRHLKVSPSDYRARFAESRPPPGHGGFERQPLQPVALPA